MFEVRPYTPSTPLETVCLQKQRSIRLWAHVPYEMLSSIKVLQTSDVAGTFHVSDARWFIPFWLKNDHSQIMRNDISAASTEICEPRDENNPRRPLEDSFDGMTASMISVLAKMPTPKLNRKAEHIWTSSPILPSKNTSCVSNIAIVVQDGPVSPETNNRNFCVPCDGHILCAALIILVLSAHSILMYMWR